MMMVFAMPMVMEQVHQRAGEQEQIGKRPHQVSLVFAPQEIRRHREEANQYPFAAARLVRLVVMIVCTHLNLLALNDRKQCLSGLPLAALTRSSLP
jgi:hypothetical protein